MMTTVSPGSAHCACAPKLSHVVSLPVLRLVAPQVHASTSSQHILDGFSKKSRRLGVLLLASLSRVGARR